VVRAIVHVLAFLSALASSAACGSGEQAPSEPATAAEKTVSGTDALSHGDVEPRIGTSIQLASRGQATSLVAAEGSIWVAAYENDASKLFRIDPATSEVVATIPVDAVPTWEVGGDGMAAGAGAVWVTGGAGEEAVLQRIDPSTNEVVATISLGGGSGADVAVGETGVWVSAFGRGPGMRVVRVDPATSRVVATIPVEGDWIREIFALEGMVLVRSLVGEDSTLTATRLTVIDPENNRIVANRRMDEPHGPLVAWDGVIWAGAGRNLLRVDPYTGGLLGDPLFVGKGVSFTSLVAGEAGIWFLGYEPDDERVPATVDRWNAVTRTVDVSVDPPEAPIAMARGQGSIWLLNYEGSLTRIELN
jgi:DNA-binding beta-propeller fold protein YncE